MILIDSMIKGNSAENKKGSVDFIYGIQPVLEAIKSGNETERLFIRRDLDNPAIRELKKTARDFGITYDLVPEAKLNRITRKNHQGVICYVSMVEYRSIIDSVESCFSKGKDPLVLILDRITDVRNFGSICRTAECMGVSAVLIPEKGSAMVNSEAVRASAGAISNLDICREGNLKKTIAELKEAGLKVVACTEKCETDIYKGELNGPLALILGSEQDGISGEYLKLSDQKVRIPMSGKTSSLNVAVSAGMALLEVMRQRSRG